MTLPQRPARISEYARACLDALAATDHGERVSLGGAFGLAHYFEYRNTNDIDSWWNEPVSADERSTITHALEQALATFGQVRMRSWGDVVSIELMQGNKTVFSFQIAQRSAGLEEPVTGVWPGGIRVDSFTDLVASKMVALVERGAPRDFRDIYMLCQAGKCTVDECWHWWHSRQSTAGENADRARAELAIRTHLARLEQARPLAQIADASQRQSAELLRRWFVNVFLSLNAH